MTVIDLRGVTNATDDQYREKLKSLILIDPIKGCWLWQGFIHKEPNPYGSMSYRSRNWRVHRLAYMLFKGPLNPALDVCHTCDVKHCCNPDHLWEDTPKANMQDAAQKRIWSRQHQTHCRHGHEFTPENIYYAPSSPTKRQCRECQRVRQKGRWHLLSDEQKKAVYQKRRDQRSTSGTQLTLKQP